MNVSSKPTWIVACLASVCLPGAAQEITVFTPNTPARAAEVNANFTIVRDAASSARTDAGLAQSTANMARTEAGAAQATADMARSEAESAKATANVARTEAGGAQLTADQALEEAAAALFAANGAAQDFLELQPILDTIFPVAGLVGIGVMAPTAALHVGGDARFDVSSGGQVTLGAPGGSNSAGLSLLRPTGQRGDLYFVSERFVLNPFGGFEDFRFDAGRSNTLEGNGDATLTIRGERSGAALVLEADTDNTGPLPGAGEDEHARIEFRQDGSLTRVDAGFFGGTNTFGIRSITTGSPLLLDSNGAGTSVVGSLDVSGNISKGGGTFKIDHPLDPENQYLFHSFVESPDMMNVYNGNITTDAAGFAEVELPEWFDTLNRDFRYQLTPIGQFAQVIIQDEVADNRFSIRSSEPLVKVSWQVTGIRQDPYAEANRVQVEVAKPIEERGYYLHPEAYGLPRELSVGAPGSRAAQQR